MKVCIDVAVPVHIELARSFAKGARLQLFEQPVGAALGALVIDYTVTTSTDARDDDPD